MGEKGGGRLPEVEGVVVTRLLLAAPVADHVILIVTNAIHCRKKGQHPSPPRCPARPPSQPGWAENGSSCEGALRGSRDLGLPHPYGEKQARGPVPFAWGLPAVGLPGATSSKRSPTRGPGWSKTLILGRRKELLLQNCLFRVRLEAGGDGRRNFICG